MDTSIFNIYLILGGTFILLFIILLVVWLIIGGAFALGIAVLFLILGVLLIAFWYFYVAPAPGSGSPSPSGPSGPSGGTGPVSQVLYGDTIRLYNIAAGNFLDACPTGSTFIVPAYIISDQSYASSNGAANHLREWTISGVNKNIGTPVTFGDTVILTYKGTPASGFALGYVIIGDTATAATVSPDDSARFWLVSGGTGTVRYTSTISLINTMIGGANGNLSACTACTQDPNCGVPVILGAPSAISRWVIGSA